MHCNIPPDYLQILPLPSPRITNLKKLRPYILLVITLVTALVTLGYRIIRQVTLPTKSRKGNLLSSLFLLFTGLTEQIISSAEAIARMPRTFRTPAKLDIAWTFSQKYLRRGLLIAAWALFILSSLEWTNARTALEGSPATEQQENISGQVIKRQVNVSIVEGTMQTTFPHCSTILAQTSPPPSSISRWLLLRTLRI